MASPWHWINSLGISNELKSSPASTGELVIQGIAYESAKLCGIEHTAMNFDANSRPVGNTRGNSAVIQKRSTVGCPVGV